MIVDCIFIGNDVHNFCIGDRETPALGMQGVDDHIGNRSILCQLPENGMTDRVHRLPADTDIYFCDLERKPVFEFFDDFLYFRGCIFNIEDASSLYTAGGVFFLRSQNI